MDEDTGTIFCLLIQQGSWRTGTPRDHGLVADDIYEVEECQ